MIRVHEEDMVKIINEKLKPKEKTDDNEIELELINNLINGFTLNG